jgi:transglutaminase-like putative cysteine protease
MTRPRARLTAFFALVSFGALQWVRLLDPAPVGRTIWFLLAAIVAGIGLRWCNRLERRRRWGATAGIAVVLVLVGLLLAGVPFSLVEPRGWGDLASGLSQGIETLPSMRIPYRGAEPWAHATLVFIGYLLVALATVLACLPRGDARPGRPLAAAVVVGVLVGVPSVSLESGSPVLLGLVFTALLVAYLRIDRVRHDAIVWAGATVAGVLLVALVLAPRVDADRPLIDYEAIAASVSKTDGASFNWSHSYGPLNWPRTGRELLRIRTDRAAYWKATNLVDFDGVRWATGGDRWLPSVDSSEVPDERDSWRQRLLVTVRGLRTTQVIGAGTTLSVANSPRPVRESGPGRFETVGDPLTSGQAYTAEVYVPAPSRRALALASTIYPPSSQAYLSMELPTEVGGPQSIDGTASFPGSSYSPRVRFSPWGSGQGPALDLPPFRRDAGDGTAALEASRYARTWDLSQRLKAESTTPAAYVRRVQEYLSNGFGYTETPRGSDVPLDTFLFDEKAGYCQQFSGAMALLLRMAGIPARIAAGFSPGTRDDKRGEMVVRDIDAHSWVEAYFPDIGWVTFDPTPADSPARGRDAEEQAAADGGADTTDAPTPAVSVGRPFPGGPTAGSDATVAGDGDGGWSPPLLLVIAAVLAVAGGATALWTRTRRVRRVREASPGDPTALAIDELHRALRRSGRRVGPDTTLHGLATRFAGTGAEGYLRQLATTRYGTTPREPDRSARAGLRRALAVGAGPLGRIRSLWALPPAPPSLRRLRGRRRDGS